MKIFYALCAVLALSAASFAAEKQTVFTGYLSDVLCGTSGYLDGYQGNEKFNLKVSPEKNNVMCLLMDNCRKTGYGIFVKQGDGKYAFYKFDKKGSDLAYTEVLSRMKNSMDPAPKIEVKGTLKGDTITVSSIKALPSSGGAAESHKMKM